MRFAHLADVHIGSWRDPKLKSASTDAFIKAIDECLSRAVDFVLFSGDLFNTAMPPVDLLKIVVGKLKSLKDASIPFYLIAGSHDFAASGKTMLDVLEEAGLAVNVVKGGVEENKLILRFSVDEKTGAKITGMIGKKGMLERSYYESLDKTNLEDETGFKIFMFHTALSEFKPKELEQMDAAPLSLLPKCFDYYAGGHVHYIFDKNEEGYGRIVYPGPLFPCNFKEIEDLGHGGLYFIDTEKDEWLEYFPLELYASFKIKLDCAGMNPNQVEDELLSLVNGKDLSNHIVTMRLVGRLSSGKPSDIDFNMIHSTLDSAGAYFVMRNTTKLTGEDFEEVKVEQGSVDEVEGKLIREQVGQVSVENLTPEDERIMTEGMMGALSQEKREGETKTDYEKRLKEEIDRILKL